MNFLKMANEQVSAPFNPVSLQKTKTEPPPETSHAGNVLAHGTSFITNASNLQVPPIAVNDLPMPQGLDDPNPAYFGQVIEQTDFCEEDDEMPQDLD